MELYLGSYLSVITSRVNLLQRRDTLIFCGLRESKCTLLNISKMQFVT